jgi:hypothetical protein
LAWQRLESVLESVCAAAPAQIPSSKPAKSHGFRLEKEAFMPRQSSQGWDEIKAMLTAPCAPTRRIVFLSEAVQLKRSWRVTLLGTSSDDTGVLPMTMAAITAAGILATRMSWTQSKFRRELLPNR